MSCSGENFELDLQLGQLMREHELESEIKESSNGTYSDISQPDELRNHEQE